MRLILQTYILHEFDERLKKMGAFCVPDTLLQHYNDLGYAVYWCINELKGTIKATENLKSIRLIHCETDSKDGTSKAEVLRKLKLAIEPTFVVESKNGFHIYYMIEEDILAMFEGDTETAAEFYKDIVRNRLNPFFGGDKRVLNPSTLLRVPGFYHRKNYPSWTKDQSFLVKQHSSSKKIYPLNDILSQFKRNISKDERIRNLKRECGIEILKTFDSENIFDSFNSLDCMKVLTMLSGHKIVRGDKFSFIPNSSGHQICVDGKSTANWIDTEGKIGGGCMSSTNWMKWYLQKDVSDETQHWKIIRKTIGELFPEL